MSILYLIDRPHPWVMYVPALVRLARQERQSIELLSVVSAMGTGTFTSNFPADDEYPTLKPHDTQTYEHGSNALLRDIGQRLEVLGLSVRSTWRPELNLAGLEAFMREQRVTIFAHTKPGVLERLWRTPAIQRLHAQGIRVALLEPYSGQGDASDGQVPFVERRSHAFNA